MNHNSDLTIKDFAHCGTYVLQDDFWRIVDFISNFVGIINR